MSKVTPTPKHVRENGSDKFTRVACAIRVSVGCAITGNGNVPAFLARMDVAGMYELWRFTQSPAFGLFDRAGLASGGRALFYERKEQAEAEHLVFAQEMQERFAGSLNLDDGTVPIEVPGWMMVSA